MAGIAHFVLRHLDEFFGTGEGLMLNPKKESARQVSFISGRPESCPPSMKKTVRLISQRANKTCAYLTLCSHGLPCPLQRIPCVNVMNEDRHPQRYESIIFLLNSTALLRNSPLSRNAFFSKLPWSSRLFTATGQRQQCWCSHTNKPFFTHDVPLDCPGGLGSEPSPS